MSRFVPMARSASLGGYAELARHLGLNPDAMLRRVGLNPQHLSDPDMPINTLGARELLEASAAASRTEDFGLQLARNRRLSNLGPISAVMREAPTAREALDVLCRYMRLLNAALLTRIEDHEDLLVVRGDVLTDAPGAARQSIELTVGVLYGMIAELVRSSWKPRRVCFEHRPPHGPTIHRAMFRVEVEFNASFNGIVCAARDLMAPLPATDSRLAPYARRVLDQALSTAGESSTYNASQIITALLPSGRCTADQVAKHLGVDRRTLHRHLLAEGMTFSLLLRRVRSEFASRHILDSDRSLAELADLLGFSTPSAFAFWFRKNFGMTVSTWKQRRRQV